MRTYTVYWQFITQVSGSYKGAVKVSEPLVYDEEDAINFTKDQVSGQFAYNELGKLIITNVEVI